MKKASKKPTSSASRIKNIIGYCVVLVCFVGVALFVPHLEEGASYGVLTMIPPLCIFAFILLTKKILEGFFWSSLLAVFMQFRWNILTGFIDQVFENITEWDNFWVIYLFLLGGAITFLFQISGAGTYFARWVSTKIKSRTAAMLITSFLGWPLSVDDYMSGLVIGNVMSPLLDEHGVPREMTAYIIRASVTAPACILPIGCWGIFVGAVIDMWDLDIIGGYSSGFAYYLAKVLPWLFFPFAVMLVCWLVILGVIPLFGKMKRAHKRVEDGGSMFPPKEISVVDGEVAAEEVHEEAPEPRKRVNLSHFFVPVIAILVFGYLFEWDMAYGITWGLLVSFVYYVITGVFTTNDSKNVVTEGFAYMSELCIMMTLGLVLCNGLDSMGFVNFVVDSVSGFVTPALLPFLIFFAFSCTEILVTFNYTLYLIAMPIVVALAQGAGANVGMCIGALVSTGVFGYSLAFSSDGGMIACGACGNVDIYEQNTSQYPYMMISWVLAALSYLVVGLIF